MSIGGQAELAVRIVEGVFAGPLGGGGKTSVTLSGNDNYDDQRAQVFALELSGPILENAVKVRAA